MSRLQKLAPRKIRFEGLESRKLMAADFGLGIPVDAPDGDVPAVIGDGGVRFGVEREMKESGEKGGTEDINIGIGELQENAIAKEMDSASSNLAQFAINGNSPEKAEIDFVEVAGGADEPVCYLKYKLDRAFVKSWSTSGDADDTPTEEVSLNFTKIEYEYQPSTEATDEVFSDADTQTITFTGLE